MINTSVLVLNRLWQAVNICSVKRAFCLLYQGHAQVVTETEGAFSTFDFNNWKDFSLDSPGGEFVRTVSFKVKVPRIIVLVFYDRLPVREVRFTRKNIYERDGNRCQYCGKKFETKDLTLDHVIPVTRGGRTTWDNIVSSCVPCNTRKGGRLPNEVDMRPIRQPRKPRWQTFILVRFGSRIHESWRHFIDMSYWNVELGEDEKQNVPNGET